MTSKRLLSLISTFFIASSAFSQTFIFPAKLPDSAWHYFNQRGEVMIKKIEKDSYPFSEDGIVAAGQGRFVLINKRGQKLQTDLGEKVHLKDLGGKFPKGYSSGFIIVEKDFLYGCMDTLGRIRVPIKYTNIMPFSNGYGTARINTTYYILNRQGAPTKITNPDISDVQGYNENLAPFKAKHKWGFIDTLANVAIPAQFSGIGRFIGGLAWARNDDDLIGFINTEGKWVIEPRFKVVRNFDEESGMTCGAMKVMGPDHYYIWKWVYINTKGEVFNFGDPEEVEFSGGYAIQRKGDLFGFIDCKGEWAIQPVYEAVHNFNDGLAWAKQNRLWGIIDKQNNWVLTPRFAGVKDMVKLKDYKQSTR